LNLALWLLYTVLFFFFYNLNFKNDNIFYCEIQNIHYMNLFCRNKYWYCKMLLMITSWFSTIFSSVIECQFLSLVFERTGIISEIIRIEMKIFIPNFLLFFKFIYKELFWIIQKCWFFLLYDTLNKMLTICNS